MMLMLEIYFTPYALVCQSIIEIAVFSILFEGLRFQIYFLNSNKKILTLFLSIR